MQSRKYSIDHEGEKITAVVTELDLGFFILLTGGSRTHIGAVSSAGFGDDIDHQFPGHRDEVVSRMWADAFYETFNEPVVAACGIHYDGVNKEQINSIVDACRQLLDNVIGNESKKLI